MISPKTITDPKSLAKYHDDHLAQGDYYDQDHQTPGEWAGQGAEALGLSGVVGKEDFARMAAGLHPDHGDTLTDRMKDTRRAAYDFTISPPKSVSVAALVGGDARITQAHQEAILEATRELERHAAVRVRAAGDPLNGKDRLTANMVAAVFHHDTSRAVSKDVVPDPHLHSHVVVFNATLDQGKWKAIQNYEMFRSQKLVEAVYYHDLSRRLHALGYATERSKDGFRLKDISPDLCDKFSKRHFAIQEKTAELKAAGAMRNEKSLAAAVAHDKRVRKDSKNTLETLRADWETQLSEKERKELEVIQELAKKGPLKSDSFTAKEALDQAESHIFERSAIAHESNLLRLAVENMRGSAVTVEDLRREFEAKTSYLRDKDSRRLTTQEAVEREEKIVAFVKNGREQFKELAPRPSPAPTLNEPQRQAVQTILSSRDFITVFRGGAGTGKSFALREVDANLKANGHTVQALAPQSRQVDDLRADGFETAQTVARFLQEKDSRYRQILLVDEAGQIGGKDMEKLLQKAQERGCRVILSGDTHQHGAVAATDALLVIERYGQARTAQLAARVDTIQRQKPLWYRQAVAQAEAQRPAEAFETLEKNAAIVDVSLKARVQEVSRLAAAKISEGKSCLVVSQTNQEVGQLNDGIRAELKNRKVLQGPEWKIEAARPVDLTQAQKMQSHHYSEKTELVVSRGRPGLATGERLQFELIEGGKLVAKDNDGQRHSFSREEVDRLRVQEKTALKVCKGDQLLIRSNLKTGTDRLSNGSVVTVDRVEKGTLFVETSKGKSIAIEPGKLVGQRGYASTSYSAQGKTVSHVIVSDSQCKAATSAKEFYVSISRGRESISVFTSDRASLKQHIENLRGDSLALSLKKSFTEQDVVQKPGTRVDLKTIKQNVAEALNPQTRGLER